MSAKIAIVYYSTYGHVATMAKSVAKGVEAAGATCDIYQVAETLSDEILGKMGAPAKLDYPIITADKMAEYDGVIFGLSGRFGAMPAQIKTFMDSCGGLWQKGAMTGKAAGTFTSVATMGGGQESVNMSCLSFFAHQGMCFVPLGYTDPQVFTLDEVHGASPYGSGTFASVSAVHSYSCSFAKRFSATDILTFSTPGRRISHAFGIGVVDLRKSRKAFCQDHGQIGGLGGRSSLL